MPVTIAKATTKVQAKPKLELVPEKEPTELSLEELADKYGSLQDQVSALQESPVFTQFNLITTELRHRLATSGYEPTDAVEIKGQHWFVEASACSKEPRKITDPMKVLKFVGADIFAKLVTVPVGKAEKYLTPEQLEQVVSEEAYTKNRKLTPSFLG